MSGRKASEVSSVLNRSNVAADVFEKNLDNMIKNYKNNISNYLKNYEENKNLDIEEISKEAYVELKEEAKLLSNEIKKIKKEIPFIKFDEKEFQNRKTKIKKEIEFNNKEIARIFNNIKGRNDYCDYEYNQALNIEAKFNNIKRERNELERDLNQKSSSVALELNKIKRIKETKTKLIDEVKKLNSKVNEIIEIRKKADKIKEYIIKEISEIDEKIANKFFKNEYQNEIKTISEEIKKLENSKVLKVARNYEIKIAEYKNKLDVTYREYLEKKSKAETILKGMKEKFNANGLYDPMEYYLNVGKAEKIDLLEYLKKFAENKYVNEIKEGVDEVEKNLKQEKFEEIFLKYETLNSLIEDAIEYSKIKFEQQQKNIDIAFGIRTAMKDLGYHTTANLINEDINNGFRVVSTVGDEIIDFDRVQVDEDGKINIDIDHTEDRVGTCTNSWSTIRNRLHEEGILLEDITKNGRSILYSNEGSKKKFNDNKERTKR